MKSSGSKENMVCIQPERECCLCLSSHFYRVNWAHNFNVLEPNIKFIYQRLTRGIIWINQQLMCWWNHKDSQVEWPLPAHLDLYQIVRPSSRRRKCRCFFHDRDFTFLRVDPAIITLTSGSSWMPAQSHVKSHRSPSELAGSGEDLTCSKDSAFSDSVRIYGLNTKLNSH